MKKLGLLLLLAGMSTAAFAADTGRVTCSGTTTGGDPFTLSFCYTTDKFQACAGKEGAIQVDMNGLKESGYYPQEIYVHAEGGPTTINMKSQDDGLNRYVELEYMTGITSSWSSLKFRLIYGAPYYYQSVYFTCDTK